MSNIFKEILAKQFNITDTETFKFKQYSEKEVSNKNVRGSVRSQLGKFLPNNQFESNRKLIEKNPLP